jgi:hypothetical protein
MSTVYLINVGANGGHRTKARSPRFPNGSFEFVPFPWDGNLVRKYSAKCKPFVRTPALTHDDPDWQSLTYGDDCSNRRAGNLRHASDGDILLFWGLLWDNIGTSWSDFTGQKGWYLFGALRIAEILTAGQCPQSARPEHVARAQRNVHFNRGPLSFGHRVFIGDPSYSTRFQRAVDLEGQRPSGLVYQTMRDRDGNFLTLNANAPFYSYLRTCRAIWNLNLAHDRRLARTVRDRILRINDYDLLADVGP